MDTLVLIKEEDGEGGGIAEFLGLVLAEIAEEAGFLVKAVGFIAMVTEVGLGIRMPHYCYVSIRLDGAWEENRMRMAVFW